MFQQKIVGLFLGSVFLVALGCGTEEPAEPKDSLTKRWVKEFANLERQNIAAPVLPAATLEELWEDLRKLDRRILELASEEPLESTAEFEGLARELQGGIHQAKLRRAVNREAAYRIGLATLYLRMGFTKPSLENLAAVSRLVGEGAQPLWKSAAHRLRGDVLRSNEDLAGAVRAYAEAVRSAGQYGDWDRARQALAQIEALCSLPEYRSDMETAIRSGGDLTGEDTEALAAYCEYLMLREEPGAAAYLALRRAEKGVSPDDPVWRSIILSDKATWLVKRELFEEAIGAYQEALTLQRELNDGSGLLDSALRFGVALEHRRDPGDAELAAEMYRVAYHRARQSARQYEEAAALNYLGLNLSKQKEMSLALACLVEAASVAAKAAPETPLEKNIRRNTSAVRKVSSVEMEVMQNRRGLLEKATEL
jgi:tetratricopeptide (TPR) repeat protein